MKTRAWDGHQWRTDYVVMPNGNVRQVAYNSNYAMTFGNTVNWKLSHFTGHHDIENNEIYEHHIIKLASGSIGVVVFENGSFIVDIKKHSEEFEFYEWPAEYFQKYDFDDGFVPGALIIGDAFTTPELLEV